MARPRPWSPAVVAVMLLALAGCRSAGDPGGNHCLPRVGMTVDQLTACGCLLMKTGSLDTAMSAPEHGGRVQRIIVVNYLCPLGAAGFARVIVRNGVADEVFH
jgi:hypothetical protein